ncbi:MAG: hypothetical protein WAK17_06585 [Candidatus Nitrosopolaris sp.]
MVEYRPKEACGYIIMRGRRELPLGNSKFERRARLSIFDKMLSTIAFVGVTTKTGEYSLTSSKLQLEITVDFQVPGGPFIGIVSSSFILSLAARCS